jgi:hypothetical protein
MQPTRVVRHHEAGYHFRWNAVGSARAPPCVLRQVHACECVGHAVPGTSRATDCRPARRCRGGGGAREFTAPDWSLLGRSSWPGREPSASGATGSRVGLSSGLDWLISASTGRVRRIYGIRMKTHALLPVHLFPCPAVRPSRSCFPCPCVRNALCRNAIWNLCTRHRPLRASIDPNRMASLFR